MPNRFDRITNYLVVPLKGAAKERTVKCEYFLKDGDNWIAVAPDKLRSDPQDIVCLSQPPPLVLGPSAVTVEFLNEL